MLSGYTLDFGVSLAATNSADIQVYTVRIKRAKKKTERVLKPITSFRVFYVANDAIEIDFRAKQTFRTGGQITVLGGMETASGSTLSGNAIFTISKGGKSISKGGKSIRPSS